MKRIYLVVALCGALALGACANPAPISSNPVVSAGNLLGAGGPSSGPNLGGTIMQGLEDSQYNLNQAVSIGILQPSDPALSCVSTVLVQLQGSSSGAQQFVPRISDLISLGSVAYIYAQQLKSATGLTLTVPPGCEQLIGQIVVDAANANLRVGAGMLLREKAK